MANATIHLHRHDLPDGLSLGPVVEVDTETMGLRPHRDRLCLVQMSSGDGHAHLVQLIPTALGGRGFECPNLSRLMGDPAVVKLMHFARFDVAVLQHSLESASRRSTAPRSPPSWFAHSPINSVSRTYVRNCWASICPNSNNRPTGARPN